MILATPGRKPLPANVHLLRGNPSKLRDDQLRDGVRPETRIPSCPQHLSKEARAEWKRITPHLEKLGLVSDLDRANLAAYCQAYGRWVQVEKQLKSLGTDGLVDRTPSGYKQQSVMLQIAQRAMDQMCKFGAEFGLSPSQRSRVNPSPQRDLFEGGENEDPAARYF